MRPHSGTVEGIPHDEAVKWAARIAVHCTFHAQDILDVQAEIEALHARILSRSNSDGDSWDEAIARELGL